jgi:hypothetical protein
LQHRNTGAKKGGQLLIEQKKVGLLYAAFAAASERNNGAKNSARGGNRKDPESLSFKLKARVRRGSGLDNACDDLACRGSQSANEF